MLGHGEHLVIGGDPYAPGVQMEHESSEIEPLMLVVAPIQSTHIESPDIEAYFPKGHSKQSCPGAELNFPTLHTSHADEPVLEAAVPGGHGIQPSDPGTAKEFFGHKKQVVLPADVERPEGQSKHSLFPV
jgi:hypothetical protein